MKKKLSEIIKEIEGKKGISDYFLHHDSETGKLELDIVFNNDIADEILGKYRIETSKYCAMWE